MDVLSDAIAAVRTGRPRSARLEWHAPWAQEFAPVPGSAGFQIVLRGPCWLIVPGADPVRLAAGDVVFRPHGHGHTLAGDPTTRPAAPPCGPADREALRRHATATVGTPAGGPSTVTLCGAYELDPSRAHPLLHDLPELIHLPANPDLTGTAGLLAAELERPRLGTDAIIPALLDTLLLHILRGWIADPPPAATGWAAALNDPATSAALHAMHGEPARPWTVATLAATAGLSRAPFARRFTALLGRPPLTYLTWWRMTTAARLLRDSDVPLAAVAAEVGYGSEFAFAAAFKRLHGVAPGRYRRGAAAG